MNRQLNLYWVCLASITGISTHRKNDIYVSYYNANNCIHESAIVSLFEEENLWPEYLREDEIPLFKKAKEAMPNTAFLVDEVLSKRFEIIPIASPDYPQLLKKRLKRNAPVVLYAKGNLALLNVPSVAIVGARNSSIRSLQFTKSQAVKAVTEGNVVISGGAKGVDTQAMTTALENGGKSILVLPQGIMTFSSGFNHYYHHLIQGNLLVISQFLPKSGWDKGLAMARNATIYGLGNNIIIAESGENGGTWEGAINGLKNGWPVSVRWPEDDEVNANKKLILENNAVAIDFDGNVINSIESDKQISKDNFRDRIFDIIRQDGPLSSKEIIKKSGADLSDPKMKKIIRDNLLERGVVEVRDNRKKILYQINDTGLF